ncbi:MAG: hypothetical protein K2P87_10485 [Lachnospiraceae bacterium]|nr:hypothetical protein [Lachnospiraceae bacterium]
MKRTENGLDTKHVLTVVERYSQALELLNAYDYQNMEWPKGNKATYILTYEECRKVIDNMKFGDSSSLFGNEKDNSFKGSIGTIYQSFAGEDLYPTLEEKVANLMNLSFPSAGFASYPFMDLLPETLSESICFLNKSSRRQRYDRFK